VFIQSYLIIQINFLYIKWRHVKIVWDVSKRDYERERKKQIKGVRDGAKERIKKACVEKSPLEKTPEYFKSIEQIKCQSKKI
jgi:hypothetical protein